MSEASAVLLQAISDVAGLANKSESKPEDEVQKNIREMQEVQEAREQA